MQTFGFEPECDECDSQTGFFTLKDNMRKLTYNLDFLYNYRTSHTVFFADVNSEVSDSAYGKNIRGCIVLDDII